MEAHSPVQNGPGFRAGEAYCTKGRVPAQELAYRRSTRIICTLHNLEYSPARVELRRKCRRCLSHARLPQSGVWFLRLFAVLSALNLDGFVDVPTKYHYLPDS